MIPCLNGVLYDYKNFWIKKTKNSLNFVKNGIRDFIIRDFIVREFRSTLNNTKHRFVVAYIIIILHVYKL